MTTNVLVIGSGAREHALTWKLRASYRVGDLFVAPGNPGTAMLATNLPTPISDPARVVETVRAHGIGLVVIGPEGSLAAGLADEIKRADVPVFGPSRAAARIESSKAFAKELMAAASIPTAASRVFDDYEEAAAYLRACKRPPVVKADGLAGGKGVTVARDLTEALEATKAAMLDSAFGESGRRIVFEERLVGREISAHALTDGTTVLPLPYACDHKALRDGGRGPNTGGMGAFSPPAIVDERMHRTIQESIVQPAIQALANRDTPYRGVLYPGLMLTEQGPRVIEFNCRFGDPETEVLLPRLRSDLFEALCSVAMGSLKGVTLEWSPEACVAVVLAAEGYPGPVKLGDEIRGIEDVDPDVQVFHAGTALGPGGHLVTAGGRVLTIVASGPSLESARRRAYANISRIRIRGGHFRSDIGVEPESSHLSSSISSYKGENPTDA